MALTPRQVYFGSPASDEHRPNKQDIVDLLNDIEAQIDGVSESTAAALASAVADIEAQIEDVTTLVGTGVQWVSPADVATTANITLSGEQTIDGVLTSASRVLVKNQSTPAQNGIYVSAAGAWSRASDANESIELVGLAVFVSGGTVNGGRQYVCQTAAPITVGTTALTFGLISDQTALNATLNAAKRTAESGLLTLGASSLDASLAAGVVTLSWSNLRFHYGVNLASVTDAASFTLTSGDFLYLDLDAGSSPYTAMLSAAWTTAMRDDVRNGKKLLLLINSSGALYGALADHVRNAILRSQGRLLRNRGAGYPLAQKSRNGIASAVNPDLAKLLLDVRVENAQAGKWYGITYLSNGASAGDPDYGWIINEYDPLTFGSSDEHVRIMSFNQAGVPSIDRNGGVQTISLTPALRPELTIHITLDASALPPLGTAINANSSSGLAGWSWIVDPSCYSYRLTAAGSLDVAIDAAAKKVSAIWDHGFSEDLRLTMNPTGINNLMQVQRVERAQRASTPWSLIVDTGTTDWFSPIIVEATSGLVDAEAPQIYTGGSHGSDGNAGGVATARMISWSAMVDGKPVARTFNGVADEVRIAWINEIMAWNTISFSRYVLREYITVVVRAGSIEAWVELAAMEPVSVRTQNGLQTLLNGYDSYLYYDGLDPVRHTLETTADSGDKALAPDAWATVMKSPTNGLLMTWMDRAYKDGDGKYVNAAAPLIRRGAGKIYHQVCSSQDTPLAPGEVIQYHGGYAWSPSSLLASGNADSAVVFRDRGNSELAWAFLAAGSAALEPGALYAEKILNGETVGARGRVNVSAAGVDYQRGALA